MLSIFNSGKSKTSFSRLLNNEGLVDGGIVVIRARTERVSVGEARNQKSRGAKPLFPSIKEGSISHPDDG